MIRLANHSQPNKTYHFLVSSVQMLQKEELSTNFKHWRHEAEEKCARQSSQSIELASKLDLGTQLLVFHRTRPLWDHSGLPYLSSLNTAQCTIYSVLSYSSMGRMQHLHESLCRCLTFSQKYSL